MAFLYYDGSSRTDHLGNSLTEEFFQHRCDAITQQAHQDRRRGNTPQEATIILDNADDVSLPTRKGVFSIATGANWSCATVWMIYREYRNIHSKILQMADRYYLFREQDVQSVLGEIPASCRTTDTVHIPLRTREYQWWKISRWSRGRPLEGALGRTGLRCFEPPGFRVLRRCLRQRLWRKWIRELLIMGRFAKRWKPRAQFLLHQAYSPRGRHYLEAQTRWYQRNNPTALPGERESRSFPETLVSTNQRDPALVLHHPLPDSA